MSAPALATAHAVARRNPVPGDGMLHPVVLGAVVLLVLNDRVLKAAAPGVVTGKLSDVAGLVFFPLLLVAAWEALGSLRGRPLAAGTRAVTVAVVATGLAFAAAKVPGVGEAVYEAVLGLVQWPFAAVAAVVSGRLVPSPGAVSFVADPTDLVALAALWVPFALGHARVERASDVRATRRPVKAYDLAVAGLSVGLLVGATLDGWAHTHQRLALEEILTPWHAVVYGAYVAVAIVLLAPSLAARLAGRSPRAAIRRGYGWSVAGVIGFALVGAADLGWHLAFGIEADAEALLSPTHLGLGVGAVAIASGPLRAAWLDEERPTWPGFLAPALSLVAMVGIGAFALHVANLFVDPWPRFRYELTDPTWFGPQIGVASAVAQTVVLVIPAILLVRRWPSPPPGVLTLLVGGTSAGLTFLHDQPVLVGAPVLGGFLADVVLLTLRPVAGPRGLLALGALLPACLFSAYFVVLDATGPVAWSAHLIGGTITVAALVGAALAGLALASATPPTGTSPATRSGRS